MFISVIYQAQGSMKVWHSPINCNLILKNNYLFVRNYYSIIVDCSVTINIQYNQLLYCNQQLINFAQTYEQLLIFNCN